MLNYEEFKNKMVKEFLTYLPDKYKFYGVSVSKWNKVNEPELDGLMVLPGKEEDQTSPIIYLQDLYDTYLTSCDFEATMKEAADLFLERAGKDYNLPNFEKSKDKIIFELVNAGRNEKMLETAPHRMFFDMAIIYRIFCGWESQFTRNVVLVTNDIAADMELTENELYEIAKENTPKINPAEVKHQGYLDSSIWSITNDHDFFGAGVIFYDGILQRLAERMGSDVYLMPSCVHEFFAVSSKTTTPSYVKRKVRNANRSGAVDRNEILSDSAFVYLKDQNKIEKL